LTTFRYALICLLELAQAEETLQAARIAKKFALSPHYLSVVLRELRRLGLIESQKGNRGGYRLLVPADAINLLFLHRSLAGSTPLSRGGSGATNKKRPPAGGR
jgi:Rrf2 family protein